jgi:hypothetical protein
VKHQKADGKGNYMSTAVSSSEQRILLHNVSWNLYENLLESHRDCSLPRFTYDKGDLEIMSPSPEHEYLKHTVTIFIEFAAAEMEIDVAGLGSTTFRREDLNRGF